jgi:hypothetical protein
VEEAMESGVGEANAVQVVAHMKNAQVDGWRSAGEQLRLLLQCDELERFR